MLLKDVFQVQIFLRYRQIDSEQLKDARCLFSTYFSKWPTTSPQWCKVPWVRQVCFDKERQIGEIRQWTDTWRETFAQTCHQSSKFRGPIMDRALPKTCVLFQLQMGTDLCVIVVFRHNSVYIQLYMFTAESFLRLCLNVKNEKIHPLNI